MYKILGKEPLREQSPIRLKRGEGGKSDLKDIG
jgi:hypothetical protein